MTEKDIRQEALHMSRELAALVDRQQVVGEAPAAGVTDTAVRNYVRGLEADGRRIVNGGQTGQDEWEITDWRTGETLASGTGGLDAYGEAAQRLDPDGTWLHVDNLDMDPVDVEPVGIPASLADALQDWLGMASTTDEDVAQLVGWSVEDVARHREEA